MFILDKIQRIVTYTFIFIFMVVAWIVCSPAVWSKAGAIKKCHHLYETSSADFSAMVDFLGNSRLKDSSFTIRIRPDGVQTLNVFDSSEKYGNTTFDTTVLPERLVRICRKNDIYEIRNISTDDFFSLRTGDMSNSDFDVDICLLKKGKTEFDVPCRQRLLENLTIEDSLNYILVLNDKSVFFWSKKAEHE